MTLSVNQLLFEIIWRCYLLWMLFETCWKRAMWCALKRPGRLHFCRTWACGRTPTAFKWRCTGLQSLLRHIDMKNWKCLFWLFWLNLEKLPLVWPMNIQESVLDSRKKTKLLFETWSAWSFFWSWPRSCCTFHAGESEDFSDRSAIEC